MLMKILEIIHIILILFVVTLPLQSVKVLKYCYFLPIIMPLLWVIFGSCPMSTAHGDHPDKISFTRKYYMKIKKDITQSQTSDINTLILVLIMVLIARKFKNKCKLY
tara:strand:- start:215 stop:535 length:321 start_codon:yes stop_codon:yes gene_type:complete